MRRRAAGCHRNGTVQRLRAARTALLRRGRLVACTGNIGGDGLGPARIGLRRYRAAWRLGTRPPLRCARPLGAPRTVLRRAILRGNARRRITVRRLITLGTTVARRRCGRRRSGSLPSG